MRLSLRSKLILYTVLPVVAVYLLLFALGISHVSTHLRLDARDLLVEHARHQASRLALLLSQVPMLAESLGDLVLVDPEMSQSLLYAHLIDGLRRTPAAQTAAVAYGTPTRSALMERGATAGRPMADGGQLARPPGWHVLADSIGFSRAIYRSGNRIGDSWVTLRIDEVYAELDARRSAKITLFVRHNSGALLSPSEGNPAVTGLVESMPLDTTAPGLTTTTTSHNGAEYWLINAQVPGHPWWITAAIPIQTALADARREVWLIGSGLLLSLLLFIAIIGAVAQRITRPLNTLDSAVQRIAAGHFAVAPEVRSDDELGRLASAIGRMARHIADREYQLRSSHQILEQRVNERTSALQEANAQLVRQIEETRKTQEALRRANERAQQANRAKSEFLSNMSHELRTPLHGVLGYAQILRRDTDAGDSQRESLDAIERCGQHLLTLINDILDLTRIEAGEMRIEAQPTNLPNLITDVCTIVAHRAEQKGLELRQEIADDVPQRIRTDSLKLRQILLNLLGNSVKFTTRGSVVLSVRRAADGQLAFTVTDSGVGIPPDKIDAIFEAFQQAREGQAVDGTGLGLAISQRLIRLLGGEALHAESTPDQGSRFYFCIPCEELADEISARPALTGSHTKQTRHLAPGERCRVLVIEPSDEGREVLTTLLNHVGCEVEACSDCEAAFERLASVAFDLILVDVGISENDLPGCGSALRARAAFGEPKLIAVSAHAFPDRAARVSRAGFDGYLAKPFSDQQTLDMIQALVPVHFVEPSSAAVADAAPIVDWPRKLASVTAERIRKAVEMGDVGSLFQLAEDLAEEPEAPQRDVEEMALMARMFDFDGLRDLSERLRANT